MWSPLTPSHHIISCATGWLAGWLAAAASKDYDSDDDKATSSQGEFLEPCLFVSWLIKQDFR